MATKKNNKKLQSSYKGTTIFVQISPCKDRYCRISTIKEKDNKVYYKSFIILI